MFLKHGTPLERAVRAVYSDQFECVARSDGRDVLIARNLAEADDGRLDPVHPLLWKAGLVSIYKSECPAGRPGRNDMIIDSARRQ